MSNPETIEIHGLSTIHKLCKFGADHNMEGCSFTEIVERMFAELAKSQAVPEGFVLVPKNELQEVLSNASDAMGDEKNSHVYLTTGEPSTWFDHFTVAENAVLKAIEAQEQSHE